MPKASRRDRYGGHAGLGRRPSEVLRLASDLNATPPALNQFVSGVGALECISVEDFGASQNRPCEFYGAPFEFCVTVMTRLVLLHGHLYTEKSDHLNCKWPEFSCPPHVYTLLGLFAGVEASE